MTPEERQLLSGLFDRIRGASNGPKDQEAEAFINDSLRSTPSAGYVLSQTVLVQQQALEAAAKRIQDLEAQARSGGGGQPQQETSFLGSLGRSLFGGGSPPPPPPRSYDSRAYERPPEPGYGQRPSYAPPPPQPGGPWGAAPAAAPPAQGGGFLHGAMQTAAGVAGGVLLGNAVGGLFGGHGGGGLFGGGGSNFGPGGLTGGLGGGETINNYYQSDAAGQHAEDVLQDQDQDQDDAQDAGDYDNGGGGDDT